MGDIPVQKIRQQFIHPTSFRTSGYTNSAAAGAHAPAADGTTVVVSRIQFVKDASNIIYTGFTWVPPKAWDPAASITLTLLGHKTATGTGTKVQFKCNALAFSDAEVDTATYSTTTTINVTVAANNTMKFSSAAITIDGSPTKNDIVYIQIARDSTTGNAANDDYDQTYSVFGAILTYSVNATDDR